MSKDDVISTRSYLALLHVAGMQAPIIGQDISKYGKVPVVIASNTAKKFFEFRTL
jgi:hypothetical protein